jgi:hypothetical protein
MNAEEKTVIASIFDRLRTAESQPRDPEAERFIAERVGAQPYAPYAMAQTIFVQEQALNQMNARIEELQAEVARLGEQSSSGGFLSGLFGGGKPAAPPPPTRPFGTSSSQPMGVPNTPWNRGAAAQPTQSGPWGQQQPARSGFLAGALTTAAGVAGGMLLANAVMGMMGNDEAKAAEPAPAETANDSAADAGDIGGDLGGDFDFGSGEF